MRRYQYVFYVVSSTSGLARPNVYYETSQHWRNILPDVLAKGLTPYAVWIQPLQRDEKTGTWKTAGTPRNIIVTQSTIRKAARRCRHIGGGFGVPLHLRARRWGRLSRPSWQRRLK